MIYGSVCSGIEAASVAWGHLGWKPAWFSEIEPFPCALLKERFPGVNNHGDMTKYREWDKDGNRIDILVGGTPCQSFSVAGLRQGINDPRGNLMLTYCAIANHFKPKWIVWENVPGVLSSNRGLDFASFLTALAECGYGFAYRILDAQYFGVAQRRKRVFVVGYLGDWRPAAAVLFESESLRGDIAPSREKREGASGSSQICLMGQGGGVMNCEYDITGTLRRETKGHEPIIMSHGQANAEIRQDGGAPTLTCNSEAPIITHSIAANIIDRLPGNGGNGIGCQAELSYTLTKMDRHAVQTNTSVRRLTPKECERLQGFPDDWTKIPYRGKPADQCPDGPRYKAIGNSMAVPVMRWIGKRIQKVDAEL